MQFLAFAWAGRRAFMIITMDVLPQWHSLEVTMAGTSMRV